MSSVTTVKLSNTNPDPVSNAFRNKDAEFFKVWLTFNDQALTNQLELLGLSLPAGGLATVRSTLHRMLRMAIQEALERAKARLSRLGPGKSRLLTG